MTPKPQEMAVDRTAESGATIDGETVVISGMSGLYPQSATVKEFSDILYNKINPINQEGTRWNYNHPEVSQYTGIVPNVQNFDAQFFKVHARLADSMDPMSRKILEQAYQAIYDAGLSPEQFSGKKVGVFIGSCFSESEKVFFYTNSKSGFGLLGGCKSMFANRISYWLNLKGPSLSLDEACCSSIAALEQAYLAISRGDCESAIVGGAYLSLHPQSSLHLARTIKLCKDGRTKSFDQNADGCAKSEAINVLLLQKAKDALRVYANLVHVKSEFTSVLQTETGPQYGFCRDSQIMANFLKKFYEEARVSPGAVEYVEAHGSAVPEADKAELEAIGEVFCKDREEPLPIGSVMSNIGYNEAASGISAITKVLIGYNKGKIAGNLHYETPRQDVAAVREGRLQVLTEHMRFGRTYTAVNGISVTGVNSHVLLHGQYKPKDLSRYKCDIPRLVTLSARQESGVKKIIEDLKSRPVDPEELALLHNIHKFNISGHIGRGFVILDTQEDQSTVSLCEQADYFDDAKRPLWFVYSGMGSQWAGMGTQLMRIPIFAAAIERCHQALAPKGINIVDIITSNDKSMFDNILHSFVGIAAIQIGLTDVLFALGIVPDKIIGHSVGELGCAYADGCLTAEEMILSAYSRGLVSVQTPFIRGSMAAVGLGYQQICKMCPPEIEVACHNAAESSTISGPADIMREFVGKLTAQGIFAKEVPCSNIAYHSRYIAEAGPALLKKLKEVIKSPRARSERWLSTSVPQKRWEEPIAKLSSAEYHTNNLLSPVLLEETSVLIPSNAVLVEIAPHGLLQAILKRSLPESCCNIALTRRGHPDNAYLVLEAIGKLYMTGFTPNIGVIYPKIEFPVSTTTPMLSHLTEWVHSEQWAMPLYASANRKMAASCNFVISVHDEENSYLQGHVVRGQTLFPFAAALVTVWDTLAMVLNLPKKQLSVEFRDVHFYAQPVLHDQRQLRLSVSLQRGTGRFEVLEENSKVATGIIIGNKDLAKRSILCYEAASMDIGSEDVYTMLKIKDFYYNGDFRSIHSANWSMSEALLLWRDNWVTLLDGMLQLNVLKHTHDGISVPKHIRKLCINVAEHRKHLTKLGDETVLKAEISEHGHTTCGGISIEQLKLRDIFLESEDTISLETLEYVPRSGHKLDELLSGDYYVPLQENHDKDIRAELQMTRVGDIDSLHWSQATQPLDTGIKVSVHYAGINNIDVMRASGLIPFVNNSITFGMDFSGVLQSGERVMGVVLRGACSSEVRAQPELLWPVPEHWTLEDAATVPLAYLNAFYCFLDSKVGTRIANDHVKYTILVHGGAGALGHAVISIALGLGYEVFTTVSDRAKKQFLLKLFPQLKENNIGNSRDLSFGDKVLSATNGNGCDIVISNVKGELKDVSLRCCGDSGVTYDMSQLTSHENYSFGMVNLFRCRSYVPLDISSVIARWNSEDIKALHGLVSRGIAGGYVRPLTRVTYAPHDAPRAFRLLAASAHRGRVLLQLHRNPVPTTPRFDLKSEEVHLIICDSTTLGLQLANRLIKRGARKLHLHCVCPPRYLECKMRSWRNDNVQVNVSSEDLTKDVPILIGNASQFGALAGIYIFATDFSGTSDKKFESVLTNLDTLSRKLCPSLRYFAVTCLEKTTGMSTCVTRHNDGYPATLLQLRLSETGDVSNNAIEENGCIWRGLPDVLERAALSAQPVLLARQVRAPVEPLLHQLAKQADIVVPENCSEDVTLENLGIKNEKIQSVSNYLQLYHNIALNEEDIKNMTVTRIREIEDSIYPKKIKITKGLSTFYTHVDPDEIKATTEMVFLSTLTNHSMRDDDIDVTQNHLYIVPGLEGHHSRFSYMCERLKLPALVLQPGLDRPNETIQEMAQRYADVLLKRIGFKKHFHILGFEWGIPVALEVAALFESQGSICTVFCIGFAPEELKEMLEEELSAYKTEEELQSGVLEHMFALMAGVGDKCAGVEVAVRGGGTWSEQVEKSVRTLLGRVSHSAQYARALLEAALGRLVQARRYSSTMPPLRSKLVLLRPTHPSRPLSSSAELLGELTTGEVSVHQLSAPLAHAARDARCAAIINAHLQPDILHAYDNNNHCDTYLLDADVFMKKCDSNTKKI